MAGGIQNHPDPQPEEGGAPSAAAAAARLEEARALLRQSASNLGRPTRTLRLTVREQRGSRDGSSPPNFTREELARRPRSNPRSRTPMRYESPLEAGALRRSSRSPPRPEGDSDGEQQQPQLPSQRITIRTLAGSAVGTVARIREQRPVTPNRKSHKQGPSHRKIRRWNNDKFSGLASELQQASRNSAAADVLLQAQSEAHLYRAIYDPKEHGPSKELKEFMQGDAFKQSREEFFEGSGPLPSSFNNPRHHRSRNDSSKRLTASDMFLRIDPRLRRVVVRACHNSYAAAKVVELLEDCVVSTFGAPPRGDNNNNNNGDDWVFISSSTATTTTTTKNDTKDCWWKGLLLHSPTVSSVSSRTKEDAASGEQPGYRAQFSFDSELPTGGFHRLLLQSICQFHGLTTVSRMLHVDVPTERRGISRRTKARALLVTGCLQEAKEGVPRFRLLQHLNEQDQPQQNDTKTNMVTEELSALTV